MCLYLSSLQGEILHQSSRIDLKKKTAFSEGFFSGWLRKAIYLEATGGSVIITGEAFKH